MNLLQIKMEEAVVFQREEFAFHPRFISDSMQLFKKTVKPLSRNQKID